MAFSVRNYIADRRIAQSIPKFRFSDKKYFVCVAQTEEQLDSALKLRFEVFNLELGEGLQSSFRTFRDMDDFDAQCHHILVEEIQSGKIIGTYRMQTYEMAMRGLGFYSAGEFNLKMLGPNVLKRSIELGRACIAKEHRNGRVLFLLWHGIAKYMTMTHKQFLFGCCSLNSQEPVEGKTLMEKLETNNYISKEHFVYPNKNVECYPQNFTVLSPKDVEIPLLMKLYLKYGAQVCSLPAIDRDFNTIDYLVILDKKRLSKDIYSMFF